jgi:hypothetical protein
MARSIFLGKRRRLCLAPRRLWVDGKMPERSARLSGMTTTGKAIGESGAHAFTVIPEAACGYPGSSKTQRKKFEATPDKRKTLPWVTKAAMSSRKRITCAAAVIPERRSFTPLRQA